MCLLGCIAVWDGQWPLQPFVSVTLFAASPAFDTSLCSPQALQRLQVRDCKSRFLLRNNHRLSAVVQIRPGLVGTSTALKPLLVITEGITKTQCARGWVSSVGTRQLSRAPVHIPTTLLWFKPRWKCWCLCNFYAFSFMVILTHILKIHLYLRHPASMAKLSSSHP